MNFYSLYHINTSFSSIEKKNLNNVINLCYWPLLKLAEKNSFKICIEASALSLIEIKKIDHLWIKKLKQLIVNKKVEFIGSGYNQTIFPLIPFKVNNINLKIGNKYYKSILGIKPNVALINEQVFSTSLIPIYKKNGYETIIIDWNNCKLSNKNLKKQLEFNSQKIKDVNNNFLNIIWSNSLNFQKFQQCIHGEITIKSLLKFLKYKSKSNKNICLYSNDVETFNYRPGRFKTEKRIDYNEWGRISDIYNEIARENKFIFPSDIIKQNKKKELVTIFNPKSPIITKKQAKYNISRWSLSGRDNLYINTLCYKIYKQLSKNSQKKNWEKLCYFWSSDFRTHITKRRWNYFIKEINFFLNRLKSKKSVNIKKNKFNILKKDNKYKVIHLKDNIKIIDRNHEINLSILKGLTVNSFINYKISSKSLIGKIEKGFFNHINYDVDFFSGFSHLEEKKSNRKITEISQRASNYKILKEDLISIEKNFKFNNFSLRKALIFDLNKKRFAIRNKFFNIPPGFLRMNYLTLNPLNFNFKDLYFETHNGGKDLETFRLDNNDFDHGENVSSSCSATNGLGMTEGFLCIGDKKKRIEIENDNDTSALIPMIKNKKISGKNLFRFFQSGMEYDDTSKFNPRKNFETYTWFKFSN